jgi:two-component system cell cycle sensor histidine kinase/response regulator CckA
LKGILALWGPDLQEEDIPALSVFANQVAVALENARLYEQAQQELVEREQVEAALRDSEERFRNIFENSPIGVYRTTSDGQILMANAALVHMLGFSSFEELAQRNLEAEGFGPGYPRTDFKRRIGRSGQVVGYESTWVRKDGSMVFVRESARSIDAEQNKLYYEGTVEDITERKQAEAERERLLTQIQEQAQHVQQIVDTVPEGMLLLDADGRVILANPMAVENLLSMTGIGVGDIFTRLGDCPLSELLASPPQGLWHEVTVGARSFQVIARPVESGPATEQWVLVVRDVTQEREVQRRVQQQERLATVGQLAAGIAHDFNNIMATIVLYAQMMAKRSNLSERDRERLGIINQQAQHATNLVQQILDFSRRAVLERRPLDLVMLSNEQIRLLERTLPESIEITLAYGSTLSEKERPGEYAVNGDPTRLQQVMMNLALNARDAMPYGGELRFNIERIRVVGREDAPLSEMEAGEWVQLTVADTGTGIPPDALPHVFDPFFTTKSPGKGTGLGLAQVYGIVKAHEGAIGVRSQPDEGTIFTICLPALPVYAVEPSAIETSDLTRGRGETVLVVEDSASTRQALVESLELLNYRVVEASNGREALELLDRRGQEVALVVSDVVMPEMGGIALLEALGQRGLTVKVVLLTGHPLEHELENLRKGKAGALLVDWLPKPPSLEELGKVVARGLEE